MACEREKEKGEGGKVGSVEVDDRVFPIDCKDENDRYPRQLTHPKNSETGIVNLS
jgi:hypothetical protein